MLCLDLDGTIMTYDPAPARIDPKIVLVLNALPPDVRWCTNSGRNRLDQLAILKASRASGLRHMPSALIAEESLVYIGHAGGYRGLRPWNDIAHKKRAAFHGALQRVLVPRLGRLQKTYRPIETILKHEATVFLLADEYDLPARFATALRHIVANIPHGRVTRNGGWVAALPDYLGKGNALRAYLQHARIPPTSVLAIGDQLNDIPMLDGALRLHSACPSNAAPAVRRAVRRNGGMVASQPAPLGTIEIIQHFIPASVRRTV